MNLVNVEAEQGMIGLLLSENRIFDTVSDILEPEHFGVGVHQRIFDVIRSDLNSGKTVNHILMTDRFKDDGSLSEVGGAEYLVELFSGFYVPANAVDYAKTIRGLYIRRRLSDLCAHIQGSLQSFDVDENQIMAETEGLFTSIADAPKSNEISAGDAAGRAVEWMEKVARGEIKPVRTHIDELDKKIGGLFSGRLYVVAGRPGMGKTAFALTMADNISHATPALFLSLEMKSEELSMRLIAARTGISIAQQEEPENLTEAQWQSILKARERIRALKLTIEDTSAPDIFRVRSAARRHKRKHGSFVLFIDYLGLMYLGKSTANKADQIGDVTRNLKNLAKELDIPVILMCQLNRAVEKQEDKRPSLSDLRDSGAIEQDADVVMFTYREEYYALREEPKKSASETLEKFNTRSLEWNERMERCRGKADVIISKIRQRQPGTVSLSFDGARQRFE